MRLLHLTELTILNFTYQGTWVNVHVGHKLMGGNRVFDVAPIYLEWKFCLLLRASAEDLGRVSLEA